jgi:hypothetical protein
MGATGLGRRGQPNTRTRTHHARLVCRVHGPIARRRQLEHAPQPRLHLRSWGVFDTWCHLLATVVTATVTAATVVRRHRCRRRFHSCGVTCRTNRCGDSPSRVRRPVEELTYPA